MKPKLLVDACGYSFFWSVELSVTFNLVKVVCDYIFYL